MPRIPREFDLNKYPVQDVYDTIAMLQIDKPSGVPIREIARVLYPQYESPDNTKQNARYMTVYYCCKYLHDNNFIVNLGGDKRAGKPQKLVTNPANPWIKSKQPKLVEVEDKPKKPNGQTVNVRWVPEHRQTIVDLMDAVRDLTAEVKKLRQEPRKRSWWSS